MPRNVSLPKLSELYKEHKTRSRPVRSSPFPTTGTTTSEQWKSLTAGGVNCRHEMSSKQLPFPILIDGEGKTFEAYGVGGVPTTLLIDPDGDLVKGSEEM